MLNPKFELFLEGIRKYCVLADSSKKKRLAEELQGVAEEIGVLKTIVSSNEPKDKKKGKSK